MQQQDLIRIAEKASSLYERLDGTFVPVDTDDAEIGIRLDRWIQVVADGDPSLFDERLKLDAIDSKRIPRLMGNVRLADPDHLPAWTKTLSELIPCAGFDLRDQEANIPFQEVLWPFVLYASERLEPGLTESLFTSALQDLQRGLLRLLSNLCSPVFVIHMHLTKIGGELKGSTPADLYVDFLKTHLSSPDSLLRLFHEYPVLARLCATTIDCWVESTSEFLTHLRHDLPVIGKPVRVRKIMDHLSDLHRGGRCVKQLMLETGSTLIYKPRSMEIESQFQSMIQEINARSELLSLYTYKIWNYEDHGWAEFVEPRKCENDDQLNRYYERAGMILCVAYASGITDCHLENIIAHGEHPVLIDIEVLSPPFGKPSGASSAEELAQEICDRSVLRTSFLTNWIFSEPGQPAIDIGGFTASDQVSPFQEMYWIHEKTDSMRLGRRRNVRSAGKSSPGEAHASSAAIHKEKFLTGFTKMYEFLLKEENHGIAKLTPKYVRGVYRSTLEYDFTLRNSLDPSYLVNGIDRSIQIDRLSTRPVSERNSKCRTVLRQEHEAVEKRNIPYFLEHREDGARHLTKEDQAEQISFIEASLISPEQTGVSEMPSLLKDEGALSSCELLDEAVSIGETLRRKAIRGPDGSSTWITLAFYENTNRYRLQGVEGGLYDGCCGIALFLAALERAVPGKGYGDLALSGLQTLRREITTERRRRNRFLQNGIGSGIPGISYAFAKTGILLYRSDLVQDARNAANRISTSLVESDRYLDVLGGVAGTLLGLLSVFEVVRDPKLLELAIHCGRHLVNRRVRTVEGRTAWKTVSDRPLTGFSHGAAGIAYSLLRLYKINAMPEFLQAAKDAIDYETSVFDASKKNWPTYLTEPVSFPAKWCHGAPGITLSRMAGLNILDSDHIRTDINNGLDSTRNALFQDGDDLCCGISGRIETLLYASNVFSSAERRTDAMRAASQLIRRKRNERSYRLLNHSEDGIYNTGLFKGVSGIGYMLLRLWDNEKSFPSAILLE